MKFKIDIVHECAVWLCNHLEIHCAIKPHARTIKLVALRHDRNGNEQWLGNT